MSIDVKPGRWRMRSGKAVIVEDREGRPDYPWRGRDDGGVRYSWRDDGAWFWSIHRTPFDLVEYLGPEEPQAMTEEQVNYHRAADAVARMTEQLAALKMQMPVNLAVALQATASSLETVQRELDRWQARLEQSVDIRE